MMLYTITYFRENYPNAPTRGPIYAEATTQEILEELATRLNEAKETTKLIEEALYDRETSNRQPGKLALY